MLADLSSKQQAPYYSHQLRCAVTPPYTAGSGSLHLPPGTPAGAACMERQRSASAPPIGCDPVPVIDLYTLLHSPRDAKPQQQQVQLKQEQQQQEEEEEGVEEHADGPALLASGTEAHSRISAQAQAQARLLSHMGDLAGAQQALREASYKRQRLSELHAQQQYRLAAQRAAQQQWCEAAARILRSQGCSGQLDAGAVTGAYEAQLKQQLELSNQRPREQQQEQAARQARQQQQQDAELALLLLQAQQRRREWEAYRSRERRAWEQRRAAEQEEWEERRAREQAAWEGQRRREQREWERQMQLLLAPMLRASGSPVDAQHSTTGS